MARISWQHTASVMLILGLVTNAAFGSIPDPNFSYCEVTFARTYTGLYNPGQPYDCVTILPGGSGETFAATGITIRVHLVDAGMNPMWGVPAQDIVLYDSGLCLCPGGNIADFPTDVTGTTTFSGTLSGGGSASSLTVYAMGVLIGTLPIKINSPDTGLASPCAVDASDLSAWSTARGATVGQANYSLSLDFNEDGAIDASDLSFWANARGLMCP